MDAKKAELNWHVVYTMPKCERKVATSIQDFEIESFLPMQTVVKQWSDRKKKSLVPLFPSYVFVKVSNLQRSQIYKIRDFVRFISIDGSPVVVREKEIYLIKQLVDAKADISSEDYFTEGAPVRIAAGQFAGLEGVVMKKTGGTRLLVRIDRLMKAFSFNISPNMIELIQPHVMAAWKANEDFQSQILKAVL